MPRLPRAFGRSKRALIAAACVAGSVLFIGAQREAFFPNARGANAICSAQLTSSEEAPFLLEDEAAMTKMIAAMAVKPSGDVDRDFVAMMVPHHQGAIDMARAILRYGHNEQLRRLAQEIIVTQQQEITAMRLAVGQPLLPSVPSPTGHDSE
jgi:hypothetical protein